MYNLREILSMRFITLTFYYTHQTSVVVLPHGLLCLRGRPRLQMKEWVKVSSLVSVGEGSQNS